MEMKIIANYLPQFHTIPENDMWWGKGFTEWTAVKKAIPLYDGHNEPRIPLNNNYYDLSRKEAIAWQANMAAEYGIYGFGIYHYWFSKDMLLLHKPAEIILDNKDIDIHYMFIWDNASWKRTWSNIKNANDWAPGFDSLGTNTIPKVDNGILAELIYGAEEEWKTHFNYLLPFFKDERYIKIDNRPVFGFFQMKNEFEIIWKMEKYWDQLAKESGFAGMCCMSKKNYLHNDFDFKFQYTPLASGRIMQHYKYRLKDIYANKREIIRFYDYDKCWREIIREAKLTDENTFLSGFVQFDDTPRRGKRGRIIKGATPEKFCDYFGQLLDISQKQQKEYVFLTAWNEWGEGAYLEPDTTNGYAYLSAVKKALERIEKY